MVRCGRGASGGAIADVITILVSALTACAVLFPVFR